MLRLSLLVFGGMLFVTVFGLTILKHGEIPYWMLVSVRHEDDHYDIYRIQPESTEQTKLNDDNLYLVEGYGRFPWDQYLLFKPTDSSLDFPTATDVFLVDRFNDTLLEITGVNSAFNLLKATPSLLKLVTTTSGDKADKLWLISTDNTLPPHYLGQTVYPDRNTFSSDGEWFYYTESHGHWRGISRIDTQSGDYERLTNTGRYEDVFVALSDDNEWIYFHRMSVYQQAFKNYLFRLNLTTREVEPVAQWLEQFDFVTWLDNDKWMLYATDSILHSSLVEYVCLKVDGSEQHFLIDDYIKFASSDMQHANSNDLIFVAYNYDKIAFLYRGGCGIGNLRQLIPSTYLGPNLFWANDQQWIIFHEQIPNTTDNHQIYRIHSDGSQRELLTNTQISHTAINISPDGNWIYYTDEIWIGNHFYRMRLDGTDKQKLTDFDFDSTVSFIGWVERPAKIFHERWLQGLALILISLGILPSIIHLIFSGTTRKSYI